MLESPLELETKELGYSESSLQPRRDSLNNNDYFYIQEEIRILGSLQINIGIFHLFLGYFWYYLQVSQFIEDVYHHENYSVNIIYPLIAAVFHIISGSFVILTEKKRQRTLAKVSGLINIASFVLSIYGLVMLIIEFLHYDYENIKDKWPEHCGQILSKYMFLYTVLYVSICCIILKWSHRAIYGERDFPNYLSNAPHSSTEHLPLEK